MAIPCSVSGEKQVVQCKARHDGNERRGADEHGHLWGVRSFNKAQRRDARGGRQEAILLVDARDLTTLATAFLEGVLLTCPLGQTQLLGVGRPDVPEADLSCTGETVDTEIKALVGPVSVFIGFGWKQAFVGAILTIDARETLMPAPVQTLACTVVSLACGVTTLGFHIQQSLVTLPLAGDMNRRAYQHSWASHSCHDCVRGRLKRDTRKATSRFSDVRARSGGWRGRRADVRSSCTMLGYVWGPAPGKFD